MSSIKNHVDSHWNRLNYLQNRGSFSVDDKLTMMLNIGLDILGMDMGIMSRIVDTDYHIKYCTNPKYIGTHWHLSDTFCDLAIYHNSLVDLADINSVFQRHPAYHALKIESYIGIPFEVHHRIYGTLAFIKAERRKHDFTADDVNFMLALSQAVTRTLEAMVAV